MFDQVGPEAGSSRTSIIHRSRRDTECCKLRGRPRAIPPGFQADSCQTCGLAFFACAFEACTNESAAETDCKLSIP